MKKISLDNYTSDKYYANIVRTVDTILTENTVVTPIDLFLRMGLLSQASVQKWRAGQIPYLEKAILCNLSSASRILRVFRMHAHDLNLQPSQALYTQQSSKRTLRFTKTGDRKIEEAYCRHFIHVVSKKKKRAAAEQFAPADQSSRPRY
jgi:hypothetical protein